MLQNIAKEISFGDLGEEIQNKLLLSGKIDTSAHRVHKGLSLAIQKRTIRSESLCELCLVFCPYEKGLTDTNKNVY